MFGGMSFGIWFPWILAFIAFIGSWYVGIVVWGNEVKQENKK